jgi:hypothetical protein
MKRTSTLILVAALGVALLMVSRTAPEAWGQSADPQSVPQLSAEQQLDQLKLLEQQLQKDRAAVHAAIAQAGWDSDQVDAARGQLFRDRTEYRKLRRSLRAAGVPLPTPAGMGPGFAGRGARAMARGERGPFRSHRGRNRCHCPCGRW